MVRDGAIVKAGIGAVWELCDLPGRRPRPELVALRRAASQHAVRVLASGPDSMDQLAGSLTAFCAIMVLIYWVGGASPEMAGRQVDREVLSGLEDCPGRDRVVGVVAQVVRILVVVGGEK